MRVRLGRIGRARHEGGEIQVACGILQLDLVRIGREGLVLRRLERRGKQRVAQALRRWPRRLEVTVWVSHVAEGDRSEYGALRVEVRHRFFLGGHGCPQREYQHEPGDQRGEV